MSKKNTFIVGLMSGTSLDGIDLVYVKFDAHHYQNFKILASDTFPYSPQWKLTLQDAISYPPARLQELDLAYGKLLGNSVNQFINNHNIKDIDLIASHGHTVFHQPDKGVTLQIGNGQKLANTTQQTVICDFRTQDVQLGGQGAPLVPIGDALLFPNYHYCINIGGFANISYKVNGQRIAFDICPANIVLNHYCQELGIAYDENGKHASKGRIHHELLNKLNALGFYNQNPPKSLGLEWVQQDIFPLIDGFQLHTNDILRTFVEHIAYQISNIIQKNQSVLVTGGGVYNKFLMRRIEHFTKSNIKLPSKEIIEYKEALIFAFLGLLRSNHEINCLQSVTGATRDHSSGVLFYPEKIK